MRGQVRLRPSGSVMRQMPPSPKVSRPQGASSGGRPDRVRARLSCSSRQVRYTPGQSSAQPAPVRSGASTVKGVSTSMVNHRVLSSPQTKR